LRHFCGHALPHFGGLFDALIELLRAVGKLSQAILVVSGHSGVRPAND
jgi:hypothetical protein